jgi:transcriptional regulator with XRE-family HTH domain
VDREDSLAAGQQLKLLRNRRNITVREVEQASRRIADAKHDKRYQISNGWLAQLENGVSEPSICKLFSLSVIYHVNLWDLLRLYDIDVGNKEQYESVANPHLTQLLPPVSMAEARCDVSRLSAVTCLASDFATRHTPLDIPRNGKSHITRGYLGSSDMTMYPLIRPGALLEIDTSQNKLQTAFWHNEFDRPIYFVELRNGYACGWCELKGNQLLIIPHHSSPAGVRGFTYLREAEIVGRVVAYHTRCVELEREKATGT